MRYKLTIFFSFFISVLIFAILASITLADHVDGGDSEKDFTPPGACETNCNPDQSPTGCTIYGLTTSMTNGLTRDFEVSFNDHNWEADDDSAHKKIEWSILTGGVNGQFKGVGGADSTYINPWTNSIRGDMNPEPGNFYKTTFKALASGSPALSVHMYQTSDSLNDDEQDFAERTNVVCTIGGGGTIPPSPSVVAPNLLCPNQNWYVNYINDLYGPLSPPQLPYDCGFANITPADDLRVQAHDNNGSTPGYLTNYHYRYLVYYINSDTGLLKMLGSGWKTLGDTNKGQNIPSWAPANPPTNNQKVFWTAQVRAYLPSGVPIESSFSEQSFFIANPPIGDPFTIYTLTPGCSSSGGSNMTISWSPRASNDTGGYRLIRKRSGYADVEVTPMGSPYGTYPDTGLAGNTTYTYQLSVSNPYGTYTYSNSQPVVSLNCYGSDYLSQTPPPNQMQEGQAAVVALTFQNIGTGTWTNPTFKLGSQNPQDNTYWGLGRVLVGSSVGPGIIKTFNFTATAGSIPGLTTAGVFKNFQWRVLEESPGIGWFGELSDNFQVTVYPAITGSCSASPNPAATNTNVTWSFSTGPTGGTGTYSYLWSSTDGLTGTGNTANKTYSSEGTKDANVVITSGTMTKTVNCTNLIADGTPPVVTETGLGLTIGDACYTQTISPIPASFSITATDTLSGIQSITYKIKKDPTGSTTCLRSTDGTFVTTCADANTTFTAATYIAPFTSPRTAVVNTSTMISGGLANKLTYTATATKYAVSPMATNGVNMLTTGSDSSFETKLSCLTPFLKSTGGDIHSNENINIPGGQQ